MSPSEETARAMGVYLLRRDTTEKRTKAGRSVRLFAFEGPPTKAGEPRRVLHVEWHTRRRGVAGGPPMGEAHAAR